MGMKDSRPAVCAADSCLPGNAHRPQAVTMDDRSGEVSSFLEMTKNPTVHPFAQLQLIVGQTPNTWNVANFTIK